MSKQSKEPSAVPAINVLESGAILREVTPP